CRPERRGPALAIVGDDGEMHAHVQLEPLESRSGSVADPSEFLRRGARGGIGAGAGIDRTAPQVDVATDDGGCPRRPRDHSLAASLAMVAGCTEAVHNTSDPTRSVVVAAAAAMIVGTGAYWSSKWSATVSTEYPSPSQVRASSDHVSRSQSGGVEHCTPNRKGR